MNHRFALPRLTLDPFASVCFLVALLAASAAGADHIKELQKKAVAAKRAAWGHWGVDPEKYSFWNTHSNRLIPAYTFGVTLADYTGEKSLYRHADRIAQLYGRMPDATCNPTADYCDQTDIYRLQQAAVAAGKKYIVLIVFDGMDWQTTRAAAIHKTQSVAYREGRGTGFYFQDYRAPTGNDFGYFVCSPHNEGTKCDVDGQILLNPGGTMFGGYDASLAGAHPWDNPRDQLYLLSKSELRKQAYTDSSSAATSLCTGFKTYNDTINCDAVGNHVTTIARQLQQQGYGVGVVTSVPICHATPACAYANNVWRDDYQDLTRDLVGLPSISHRQQPLPGVDVLLGGGWGEDSRLETAAEQLLGPKNQGTNYVPGNKYITDDDLRRIDLKHGGKYRVALRTPGRSGKDVLAEAARDAEQKQSRLFGFFGVKKGHLPFRTADGGYDPVAGIKPAEVYSTADLRENPTLADFTEAALTVLSSNPKGFWLMVESGDVDWGNHDNNLDNAIGAVESGDLAFRTVVQWINTHDAWKDAAVIVTADHGHYFVLEQPEALLTPK